MASQVGLMVGPQCSIDPLDPENLLLSFGEYQSAQDTFRITAVDAAVLQEEFSVRSKSVRYMIPVFSGFPDVKGRKEFNPSAPALGWVDAMASNVDGLRFHVRWSVPGRNHVTQGGYKRFAPVCFFKAVNGNQLPIKVVSLGLTNESNVILKAAASNCIANDKSEVENRREIRKRLINSELSLLPKSISADARYNAAWQICARKSPHVFKD